MGHSLAISSDENGEARDSSAKNHEGSDFWTKGFLKKTKNQLF